MIIIRDIEQGSPEWGLLRADIPTASGFSNIITDKGKAKTGAGPETYMQKLLAGYLLKEAPENISSAWMDRGNELEQDARDYYSFVTGSTPEQVTFCYKDENKLVGCSPDSLVGDDGLLEIKCPAPHTHIKYLLDNALPPEYTAQVQGQLWVTGRQWCDFLSYHPDLPRMIVRVEPDPVFQETLEGAIAFFTEKMMIARAKLDAMAA